MPSADAETAPSAELAEARRRLAELESLVEWSPVAVVVMDADERVTDWNPAAAELFGYSVRRPSAVRSTTSCSATQVGTRGARSRARRWPAVEQGDRRRRRKDGTPVDVELMLAPLSVEGSHVGFLGIYHDITEAQLARERARRSDGDAGAREDIEPRGHDRVDPRRAAKGRAL